MTDYWVALPVEARNISPNLPTFEREGKDGNEVIVPIFSSDNFVGEVLGGKWVKGDDGSIVTPVMKIAGGSLSFSAKSDAAGTDRTCWLYSKNQFIAVDGSVLDVHLELPSHTAAQDLWFSFFLSIQKPDGTTPSALDDFLRVDVWTDSATYKIRVVKEVGGTNTVILAYTAITNAEGTFRIKFNEDKLGYTNIYFHDGSGAVDEGEDEVTDSPFALDLNDKNFYPSYEFSTSEDTVRVPLSDSVTVFYPFGSDVSQLVKFDAPRGALAGTETLFAEAEDETLGAGVTASDLADDSGTSVVLNAQNEYVRQVLNPISGSLSKGRYLALFRIKDTAQVTSDVSLMVYNTSDSSYLNIEGAAVLKTVEGTYKVYQLVFDVDALDSGDNCYLQVLKATATANTVYVDWFRVVPYDGMNGRCKLFDSMNEASESDWKEVYAEDHQSIGDLSAENGLIRLYVDLKAQYGLMLYYWDGTAWNQPLDYFYLKLNSSAKNLSYPFLKYVVSVTSEQAVIDIRLEDTAIQDGDYYADLRITLKRGKPFIQIEVLTVFPVQDVRVRYQNSTSLRFGFVSDAETNGIGDDDVSEDASNTTLSDNFMVAFDNAGTPVLAHVAVNIQPDSRFQAPDGGDLIIEDYTTANLKTAKIFVGLLPFSRISSLFAEAEDETINAAARLYFDGAGEDTDTENSGVWAATTNCAKDENNLVENSVGSACVEITSSAAGAVVATCTPAAPLGKLTKFDLLKLYLHGTPDGGAVTVRLVDADGDSVTKSQAITGTAVQYSLGLPHSATDLQGWTQVGTYNFATLTALTIEWTAAGAGELVYIDGLHDYIGTTTARGRGETLSGSSAVVLDASGNSVISFYTSELPVGRYVALIRVKDTDQVNNDVGFYALNEIDNDYRNQENTWSYHTGTGTFAYHQIVFDVIQQDWDDGDTVRLQIQKATATENSIFVDYFVIIPIGNGESFPQDLAHSAIRKVGSQRRPVDRRETV